MQTVVTAHDVIARFVSSPRATDRLNWWRGDGRRAQVVPAVMGHESRVVLSASLDEVRQVCSSTEHALSDV
ncbi:hypothetical protein [Actinoplanes sp. NPDC049265]|uniref:hypothetical protein n=1 Tax=Actinoplanes sp. NPDC049265 TaxID=3363902 RepID=UPI003710AA9B